MLIQLTDFTGIFHHTDVETPWHLKRFLGDAYNSYMSHNVKKILRAQSYHQY